MRRLNVLVSTGMLSSSARSMAVNASFCSSRLIIACCRSLISSCISRMLSLLAIAASFSMCAALTMPWKVCHA